MYSNILSRRKRIGPHLDFYVLVYCITYFGVPIPSRCCLHYRFPFLYSYTHYGSAWRPYSQHFIILWPVLGLKLRQVSFHSHISSVEKILSWCSQWINYPCKYSFWNLEGSWTRISPLRVPMDDFIRQGRTILTTLGALQSAWVIKVRSNTAANINTPSFHDHFRKALNYFHLSSIGSGRMTYIMEAEEADWSAPVIN